MQPRPSSAAGGPDRSDPAVRDIVSAWRSLTGSARTMLAVSGGADSSALALALRTASTDLVVAHVVHDLRSSEEAQADRNCALELARRLDLPFCEDTVAVRDAPGNTEANARRARYDALARLAEQHACHCVATAHHADDALETTLMNLLRGASLRGLAGIPAVRRMGQSKVLLVRPMLGVAGADCRRMCADAGWAWREDRTNTDTRRLRAALRHAVIPLLVALRPGAAQRVARASQVLHDAAGLVEDAAAEVWAAAGKVEPAHGDVRSAWWAREDLRTYRAVVLGETLRHAIVRMAGGRGLDRAGAREIDRVVQAIRDDSTEHRRFEWTSLLVLVDAHTVSLVRKEDDGR